MTEPTTKSGRRLLATFETRGRTNNSYRAAILTIEAEAREAVTLTRETGLDVAARAFAEHVSAIACDHTGSGAGTHTGCPERLALDAALASEDRP